MRKEDEKLVVDDDGNLKVELGGWWEVVELKVVVFSDSLFRRKLHQVRGRPSSSRHHRKEWEPQTQTQILRHATMKTLMKE